MGKLFGTDGIRGIAGKNLDAGIAYRLGLAVSEVLIDNSQTGRPKVLIGMDTRWSGDMLESAIAAGLCAMGSDVILLGVVPTPAVAFLVKKLNADAGIMISASHNPAEYNGIKVFNGNGFKLSDELEARVEEIILGDIELDLQTGSDIGRIYDERSYVGMYIMHVSEVLEKEKNPECSEGRRVLFDLSNGSASVTAKKIFSCGCAGGFSFDFLADTPNGININENCGSTHMNRLADEVAEGGYDIGIAFDGDADRCLVIDEKGKLVNGDQIIAAFADDMMKSGSLRANAAVVTSMTNLGFHLMAKERGMTVRVTDVGDRYVLEEMLRGDFNLGGEQSGHIILTDYATTGDGQITAAKILALMSKYPEKTASEIFSCMVNMPQVSINVKTPTRLKKKIIADADVADKVREIEEKLEGRGRIILRPSGTEELVRVMIEGEDQDQIKKMGAELARVIEERICGLL